MKFTKTISFKPFSSAHKDYIRKCRDCTFNFAEGAVRSGKTISNIIAFAFALETTPDKLHLATGVTLASARLNIGDCNGFGLEHLFRGRCRWGRYNGNECLYVKARAGNKVVIFTGGGKSDSYKKIRENSYGLWIATEVNKHYISKDDECFLNEAFNRQLAAKKRKVFWDFNPDYPTHPIYTEYVDKYLKRGISVNYKHFTLWDNNAIDETRRREIIAQYDTESVWYKRSILGLRVSAEGVIFKQFADNPKKWIVSESPKPIEFISIGGDYGGNLSKTAFVASGIFKNFEGVCILDAYRIEGHKGEVSPDIIENKFVEFVKRVSEKFDYPIRYAFMDSEGQYLTNGIIKACRGAGLTVAVSDSKKQQISERIACKARLLSEGRWFVLESCKQVIDCTASQLWDNKNPDRRLDDGSTDIDTADAEEYSWERFIKRF